MRRQLSYLSGAVMSALVLSLSVAEGQTPSVQSNNERDALTSKSEFRAPDLLAQAGPQSRSLFSLSPSSHALNVTRPAFGLMPMGAGANLEVRGSGTIGRLPKWMGTTGSTSYIGDSTIFEDKFGKVGIGTDTPTSRVTVAGLIETTSGGVKFPDGTVQLTAGIAPNDVVRSLNGLKGNLLLAGGANIAVTSAGNTITVAAPNALTTVAHDNTMMGNGTSASPLRVVQSEALIEPVAVTHELLIEQCIGDNVACIGEGTIFSPPIGKRLVIEHVSAECLIPAGRPLRKLNIRAQINGFSATHQLVPVFVSDETFEIFGSFTHLSASSPMRLYVDGPSPVIIRAERIGGPGTFSFCTFAMTGYMVTLP